MIRINLQSGIHHAVTFPLSKTGLNACAQLVPDLAKQTRSGFIFLPDHMSVGTPTPSTIRLRARSVIGAEIIRRIRAVCLDIERCSRMTAVGRSDGREQLLWLRVRS